MLAQAFRGLALRAPPLAALAALAVLAACSSTPLASSDTGTAAPPPPPPPVITLADACADLVRPGCTAYARCSPEHFAEEFPDGAACVAARSQECVERTSAPGNAATASDVAACATVQATFSLSCDAFFASTAKPEPQPDPACAFVGSLPEGAPCIDSGQCASGSCAVYGTDACGSCVTRATGSCELNRECPYGSLCRGGLCTAAGLLGDSCDDTAPCQGQLACNSGKCAIPAGVGDGCANTDCAPNLWCNYATLICELPLAVAAGEDCTFGADGSVRLCPAGSACLLDASGQTSSCQPAGALGSLCSDRKQCAPGLGCLDGSCQTLSAARCTATSSTPSNSYPASHPPVPAAVSGGLPTTLQQPRLVLVSFAEDNRVSELQAVVRGLAGSAYWHATTAEYGVGTLSALTPVVVPEAAPAALINDSDVQSWLADKLANDPSFPVNDGETIYAVVYPSTTLIRYDSSIGALTSCYDFGGYHQSFIDSQGSRVVYAVIPHCWYGGEDSTLTHEAVEAAGDPVPSSSLNAGFAAVDSAHLIWSLPAGGELADLCTWQPLVVYPDNAVGGNVQRSWSNASLAAFHHPCAPTPTGRPYFNAVPQMTDTVSLAAYGTSQSTRGIAIPLGESRTVPVALLSDAPMPGPFRVSAYPLGQWLRASHYGGNNTATLRFSFDTQTGVNGDTLQLTLTPLSQDPSYASEPFVLVSRFGRDTNVWLGVVGQP